jgi:hypothetical protein
MRRREGWTEVEWARRLLEKATAGVVAFVWLPCAEESAEGLAVTCE